MVGIATFLNYLLLDRLNSGFFNTYDVFQGKMFMLR
jgi:hypothetical protein